MAKRLTKQQLADEAYERAEAARNVLLGLSIGLPIGGDTLPGQIDMDGSVAGSSPEDDRPVDGIPETCPDCRKTQTLAHGWTALDRSVRSPAIQCGNCGAIITVTEAAHAHLRAEIAKYFARINARRAPEPKRTRRPRGAR